MKNASGNAVTIWTASTAQALGLAGAVAGLDEGEMAQARRFKHARDRDRYLGARTLLRHALSDMHGGQIAPAQWRYRSGPTGKPMMAAGLPPLEFNLSHAGGGVAVGVSASGPVGVDIESAAPDGRLEVVNDALSERERAYLYRLSDDKKWTTFIQFWTIKEACAKALGLGVTLDFHKLEVSLDPLCVLAPQGLLGSGKAFDIETRSICVDGHPYCLSIAKVTEAAGETSFCFRPLTNGRVAHPVDTEYGKVA